MKTTDIRPCGQSYQLMAILLVLFTATPTLAEEPDALGNAKDNFTAADHDGDVAWSEIVFTFEQQQ